RKLSREEQHELLELEALLKSLGNRPNFDVFTASELSEPDVVGIVIDEVSMVDERLGRDLESFGKKILVLGDPAQLLPVGAGGYYTRREPDVMLTDVHRQARESGILELATLIREGGSIPPGGIGRDVVVLDGRDKSAVRNAVLSSDQTLCGLNETRRTMNA